MRRVLLVTAALGLSVGAPAARGQSPVPQGSVEPVRVAVRVTSDHPVDLLSAKDFEVKADGVAQEADVTPSADHLAMAMLLDTSDSTIGGTFNQLHDDADKAAGAVRANDIVVVVPFADGAPRRANAVTDRAGARQALRAVREQPASKTALADAVLAGASLVANDDGARVVMVFTDGADSSSWLEKDVVAQALSRSGITVDVVLARLRMPRERPRGDLDRPPGDILEPMHDLAARTGGRVFDAGADDLGAQISARLAELRSTYVLTFAPRGTSAKAGWHKIEVRLKSARGDVHAPAAYYAIAK